MAEAINRLIWAPKAKHDVRNIWAYYARVASPDIADGVLREIEQSTARLADKPYLGRPRADVIPGLRSVLAQPYLIFYRLTDSSVEIVRVLHERRDFPAILRKDER
jgi:toxin ParE1/3/4